MTIITPTYSADREVAGILAESVDRHVRMPFHHYLLIPRRDAKLFSELRGPNRSLVMMEDILGAHGFYKVPLPAKINLPFLGQRRLREKWYRRGAGLLSGWLVQQIMKLSAPEFTTDEHLLMIDSDVALIRDLDWSHIREGDLVRLRRLPGGADIASHQTWRDNALKLLGRTGEVDTTFNFVGNIIAWRRSHVLRLQRQIESATHRDWRLAFARARDVSEYILYGYSCEGLSDADTGHLRQDYDLAHSLWFSDGEARKRFERGIGPSHIAVHIQSTVPMTVAERMRLIDEMSSRGPARSTA